MRPLTPHTAATVQITTLEIVGMSCDGCARKITTVLSGLEGVVHACVDLHKDQATVEHVPLYSDANAIAAAVRAAGYRARVVDTVNGTELAPSEPAVTRGCGCGCSPAPALDSLDVDTSTIA